MLYKIQILEFLIVFDLFINKLYTISFLNATNIVII